MGVDCRLRAYEIKRTLEFFLLSSVLIIISQKGFKNYQSILNQKIKLLQSLFLPQPILKSYKFSLFPLDRLEGNRIYKIPEKSLMTGETSLRLSFSC